MRGDWRLTLTVLAPCALALLAGCRRNTTLVGDRRAVTCAALPAGASHEEIELGEGRKFVRDGVRAEILGAPSSATLAISSFDGAMRDATVNESSTLALVVVGFGGATSESIGAALSRTSARIPLVVAVPGPLDDVEAVDSGVQRASGRVLDVHRVRSLRGAGVELVILPGADDPGTLAAHGRGCFLRAQDAKELAGLIGQASLPRVVVGHAAPSRHHPDSSALPSPIDELGPASVWLTAGPLDTAAEWHATSDGGGALLAVPRWGEPRTTSTPSVIAAGAVIVGASQAGDLFVRYILSDQAPAPVASGSSSVGTK